MKQGLQAWSRWASRSPRGGLKVFEWRCMDNINRKNPHQNICIVLALKKVSLTFSTLTPKKHPWDLWRTTLRFFKIPPFKNLKCKYGSALDCSKPFISTNYLMCDNFQKPKTWYFYGDDMIFLWRSHFLIFTQIWRCSNMVHPTPWIYSRAFFQSRTSKKQKCIIRSCPWLEEYTLAKIFLSHDINALFSTPPR